MITLQGIVVLIATLLAETIFCALTLAAGAGWPAALLSAGGAGGGVLSVLPRLLERGSPS
ncbi:hypothetical protein [Actinomadura sp. 6K520]|uniref:hypothetical protein n=1 Tax=Actinomadura sp. 6K520 TaxID=2530364 RepID=UPI0010441E95|nr:hypothetical protein [Actinomadura sp. 6K520]TDE32816.1 hypothetical protein E1289_14280 [Actinomadura sp. 6K520]